MDPIQIVIIVVSTLLTTLFIALGIQLWFILKEMRIAMTKVNRMLDDGCKVTGAIGEGAENVQGLVNGLKAGFAIMSSMKKKGEDHE
jgi:hypothetical protein